MNETYYNFPYEEQTEEPGDTALMLADMNNRLDGIIETQRLILEQIALLKLATGVRT
tara:strand:+ start:4335 stop:4505 length:171 start_codon:yes stop_codon:yes gene_type:complete